MDGPGRDRDVEDAAALAINSGVVLVGRLAAVGLVGGQRGVRIGGAHRRLGLLRCDGLGGGITASGRLVSPTDSLGGVRMAPGDGVPADVGADQGALDVDDLALGDPGGDAGLHRAGGDAPEPLRAPALADARQAGVVRQGLVQSVAREPADGDVDPGFPQQPPVVDDAEQEAGEHEANRRLRIDAGPPGAVRGVAPGKLGTKPAEVEHAVNPHQDVVVGNQVAQRAGHQQLGLAPRPAAQHPDPARAVARTSESEPSGFFNSPVHMY